MAEATTLAQQLAAFAVRARTDGVPPQVAASVRQRVLDVLGLCLASQDLPTSREVLAHVAAQGGVGQAHAIGLPDALPAAAAALANGVLAHSLDFDDTHLPSVLHPSAPVIPAALAAAESVSASGDDLVRAVAVGLEVTVRLGMAGYDETLGNSVFFEHGQHATSICGTLGGAVAAALLLGLDEDGIVHTLGLAASMASGIIEGNRTGGTVKRLHCGWAAQSAVVAAQLAQRGFTGPPTVLEGRFGFFEAFLRGEADRDRITEGLGATWSVPDIFFKPYPANHFTHAIIDAGIALRARGLRPVDVGAVRIGVPGAVIRTIGEPIERKRRPETGYQGQFSGPYAFAAALVGGHGLGVGLDDYTDELVQDPTRLALMDKVELVADARCDEIFPYQFPAIVTVTTRDGARLVEEVLTNRGGPQRPLSDEELAVKFRGNAASYLDPEAVAEVARLALTLDDLPDLAALVRPLTRLTTRSTA